MQVLEWNAERVAILTQLWADGLTGTEVAERLNITRNTVLGKVHRLKLPGRGRRCVDSQILEQRKQRDRLRHTENQRRRRGTARKAPVMIEPALETPKFCGSLDVPFADLRNLSSAVQNQCRWIEGDSLPRIACANETEPGRSYCGHHHSIVYTKRVTVSDDETARRAAHGKALGLSNVRKGKTIGYGVPKSARLRSEAFHG